MDVTMVGIEINPVQTSHTVKSHTPPVTAAVYRAAECTTVKNHITQITPMVNVSIDGHDSHIHIAIA
ncbi:hypothetical protein EBZ35_07745 [bacterium]|nr:hypothetical protein [bacterium]